MFEGSAGLSPTGRAGPLAWTLATLMAALPAPACFLFTDAEDTAVAPYGEEAIDDFNAAFYRMRQLGGRVKVEGWKAEPKAGAKYLVTFVFELDDEPDGYYFEVDVGSLKVRDARAEADLRERYGLPAPPE